MSQFDGLDEVVLDADALKKLQCNILRSTGRARSTQVFRRFADRDSFKAWLQNGCPTPSAATTDATSPDLVNVLFTVEGLKLLGVDANGISRMDPAFLRGPRDSNTLDKLGDGVTAGWGPHQAPWHVVELHAHNGKEDLHVTPTSDCVIEHGGGIDKNRNPITVEGQHSYGHFNILDGLSTVVYTQEDYDKLLQANGGTKPVKWNPLHPLSTLLVKDVLAGDAANAFGSYFVFRKLHQDVPQFEQRLKDIANEIERRREAKPVITDVLAPEQLGFEAFIGKSGAALIEQVKAWIFGRDTNGNTRFGNTGNDFDFKDDHQGTKCPFHAHIRKMNPRGATGELADERKRAFARRGTSGHKTMVVSKGTTATEPQTALLFWCAQASIGEQFEYIQEKWANASNVDLNHAPTPDVDTVIGRLHPRLTQPAEGAPHWDRWKQTSHVDFNVWDSIQLIAAEYLYAPSIAGFDALKKL